MGVASDLTVAIPYYERADPGEFRQSIASVLHQTVMPARVLLVQDGAVPPAVRAVADAALAQHSDRVCLIELDRVGLVGALNESIRRTSTRFYARMDADDVSLPSRFESQLEYLRAHPEVAVVGSWTREFSTASGTIHERRYPETAAEIGEWMHYRNPLSHPTVMFRTRVVREVGMYAKGFPLAEDLELWIRLHRAGLVLANVPEVLLEFRAGDLVGRRSRTSAVTSTARLRLGLRTWSIRLNALKLGSISMRVLPEGVQRVLHRWLS